MMRRMAATWQAPGLDLKRGHIPGPASGSVFCPWLFGGGYMFMGGLNRLSGRSQAAQAACQGPARLPTGPLRAELP